MTPIKGSLIIIHTKVTTNIVGISCSVQNWSIINAIPAIQYNSDQSKTSSALVPLVSIFVAAPSRSSSHLPGIVVKRPPQVFF